MSDRHREIIAFSILALMILATFILLGRQSIRNGSIEKMIDVKIEQKFSEKYRNIPRIEIEKVYTLYANGDEIVMEVVEK